MVVKMCITECPHGFHICCHDCWKINCEEACGKDSYENCKLAKGGKKNE